MERQLKITDARMIGGLSEPTLRVAVDTGEWFEIQTSTEEGKNHLTELVGAVGLDRIVNAYELHGKQFGRRALSFWHFKAFNPTERRQDSEAAEKQRQEQKRVELEAEVSAENNLDLDIYQLEECATTHYDKLMASVMRRLFERTKT